MVDDELVVLIEFPDILPGDSTELGESLELGEPISGSEEEPRPVMWWLSSR